MANQLPGARGKGETALPNSLSLPGTLHVSDNIYERPCEWSTFVKIFLNEKSSYPLCSCQCSVIHFSLSMVTLGGLLKYGLKRTKETEYNHTQECFEEAVVLGSWKSLKAIQIEPEHRPEIYCPSPTSS